MAAADLALRSRPPASAVALARALAAAQAKERRETVAAPPARLARTVGLRYVRDDTPGITRGWEQGKPVYFDVAGRRIGDEGQIARLNALAIPPAYTDVWICPDPNGHIQATARDARGRKQYRYHARWRELRDATKYERLVEFGKALPRVRRRIARDLARPGMPREKVLATVLRLLEITLVRVGNEEYARTNRSYGLTTLRTRHVAVNGYELRFTFRGKGGIEHQVRVSDRRLARIVRQCLDIPGQELFQYLDPEGKRHAIDSADVNAYLRAATGGAEFTAKDYRTWAGSVAALALLRQQTAQAEGDAKHTLVAVVKAVATRLGNTPAVCRRCYIHPALLEAFQRGALAAPSATGERAGFTGEEALFLAFLEVRARAPQRATPASCPSKS